jgi:hypothetical protein
MKVKLYVQALELGLENELERVVALIDEDLRVAENYFEPVVAKASDAYREMSESLRNSPKVKDVGERQIGESSQYGRGCWASRSSANFGLTPVGVGSKEIKAMGNGVSGGLSASSALTPVQLQ